MLPCQLCSTVSTAVIYSPFSERGTRVREIVRSVLRFTCLLLATGQLAPAGTVTLNNGDKLTCDIKKLADGQLTVSLAYANDTEMSFDWKMVTAITSEKNLKMQLDDGTEVTAKLQPAKETGKFLPQGSAAPLALGRLVSLEPEEPEPTSWTDNLSLDTDFNYGYTGNDRLNTLSWNTQNFYWGDKWEFAVLGSQNFNGYGSVQTSYDQIQGQTNVNRYVISRLFVFPWAAALHVTQTEGSHGSTWQLGGGAGWSFIKQQDHHLELMAGVVQLTNKATVILAPPRSRLPSESLSRSSPAFMSALRWQKTSDQGITWMVQAEYVHPFQAGMRDELGVQANFSIPIAGPFSADVNIQDYTSPLTPGLLSTRGLSVSTGFGLHY